MRHLPFDRSQRERTIGPPLGLAQKRGISGISGIAGREIEHGIPGSLRVKLLRLFEREERQGSKQESRGKKENESKKK